MEIPLIRATARDPHRAPGVKVWTAAHPEHDVHAHTPGLQLWIRHGRYTKSSITGSARYADGEAFYYPSNASGPHSRFTKVRRYGPDAYSSARGEL
jgi:hypothetical protein